MIPKLRNWSFIVKGGPWTAPECWTQHLVGETVDHPVERFGDGHEICTSRIEEIDLKNRMVRTTSRWYELDGPPDQKWVDYLQESGQWDKYKDLIETENKPFRPVRETRGGWNVR